MVGAELQKLIGFGHLLADAVSNFAHTFTKRPPGQAEPMLTIRKQSDGNDTTDNTV